jgi:tetratricopeptide (TPR) repeat protein
MEISSNHLIMKIFESKELISKLRSQKRWNQIIDLVVIEKLTGLWFDVFHGEELHKLNRKIESKKIFEKVIELVNKEDPEEMFLLGKTYFIIEEYSSATFWYQKAAELNEQNAQNNLAFCYEVRQ